MRNLKELLALGTGVMVSVAIGLIIGRASNPPAAHADGGPVVTIGSPLPVPVALNRTPVYDGKFFDITQPNAAPFQGPVSLTVPAGVVLKDAHVTFSVPENVPNSASLFISDGTKTLVYQIVNNTTFNAGIDLGSGIASTGSLTVDLSCYNIPGNHCQGAIMWSGYTIP